MWKTINRIRRFFRIAWLKTLFVNFYMLPFAEARKLPILVCRNVHLFSLEGKIQLTAPARFGMVRLGFLNEDFVHARKTPLQLCIKGVLKVGDYVRFSPGCTLRVYSTGTMEFKNNVGVGFGCKFFCMDRLVVESDTRFGFEVVVTDTTFHYMRDVATQRVYDLTKPVNIGSHNWIGARSYIMKGCRLPDYTIVSAGSFCNKDYDIPPYSLLAGSPAKPKREGIYRCLDAEETMINAERDFHYE